MFKDIPDDHLLTVEVEDFNPLVDSNLIIDTSEQIEDPTNPNYRVKNNLSRITTDSERKNYGLFAENKTKSGMIQATIYHLREYGKNTYSPEEREKYYSEYFLKIKRHYNEKVEQELEEFKIEIDQKMEESETKVF